MLEVQPWHVAAWRPVAVATTQRAWMIRRLAHKACSGVAAAALAPGARGQVVWACDTTHGPAGLAWDWLALRPRVLAMADPMNIVSNLSFVDAEGRPLSDAQRVIELNNLIARLPWQARIVKATAPVPRQDLPLPLAA